MPPDVIVLSPHLDDAVLSCWHVLDGPLDVRVVNVFTGSPNGRRGVWDELTGAADSAARMGERREEDRAALAVAGRASVDLPLLDVQYRGAGETPDVPSTLAPHLAPGPVVLAPAALGVHRDHELVRRAALGAARRGCHIRLYADLPHAVPYGWPSSVTGRPTGPNLQPEAGWRPRLADAAADLGALRMEVHALEPPAFERKLAAVRRYATQVRALEHMLPLDELRYEVTWTP